MSRLPHPIAFLSWVSGVLFLVVAVGWVRSYQRYEEVSHAGRGRGAQVVRSYEGRLYFDSRSFWMGARGWTWARGGPNPGTNVVRAYYQIPELPKGTLGFTTIAGTTRVWPGHLYSPQKWMPPPPLSDPRWWIDSYRAVVVPYWFPALLTAAAPALRIASAARARSRGGRRTRRGLCRACGYDLRATADRCPECGNKISTATPIAPPSPTTATVAN
jgi:hypothetical protein